MMNKAVFHVQEFCQWNVWTNNSVYEEVSACLAFLKHSSIKAITIPSKLDTTLRLEPKVVNVLKALLLYLRG